MNSKVYKQVLKECYKKLRFLSNIEDEFWDGLDEIRKINKKYVSEAEYYLIYPRHDLVQLEMHKDDLLEVCKKHNIKPNFLPVNNDRHTYQIFIEYHIQNIEITNLLNV